MLFWRRWHELWESWMDHEWFQLVAGLAGLVFMGLVGVFIISVAGGILADDFYALFR